MQVMEKAGYKSSDVLAGGDFIRRMVLYNWKMIPFQT